MNKYLFLEVMDKKGYNQRSLAKKARIGFRALNNKINGITRVTTDDVITFCDILEIKEPKDIYKIFLSKLS